MSSGDFARRFSRGNPTAPSHGMTGRFAAPVLTADGNLIVLDEDGLSRSPPCRRKADSWRGANSPEPRLTPPRSSAGRFTSAIATRLPPTI